MMSANEYRAMADRLVRSADTCGDYELILELEITARQWRWLAQVADWQDALSAALSATRETPASTRPGEP